MAIAPEETRKMRKEGTGTIDTIASFTVDGPNFQSGCHWLDSDKYIKIPDSCIVHDLKKGKSYKFQNNKMEESILSDVFKTGVLPRTTYIEFLRENGEQSPDARAREFRDKINTTLNGYSIKILQENHLIKAALIVHPCSYRDIKSHSYSRYVAFTTEKESTYTVYPHLQEIIKT